MAGDAAIDYPGPPEVRPAAAAHARHAPGQRIALRRNRCDRSLALACDRHHLILFAIGDVGVVRLDLGDGAIGNAQREPFEGTFEDVRYAPATDIGGPGRLRAGIAAGRAGLEHADPGVGNLFAARIGDGDGLCRFFTGLELRALRHDRDGDASHDSRRKQVFSHQYSPKKRAFTRYGIGTVRSGLLQINYSLS